MSGSCSDLSARSWRVFPAGCNGEFNLPRDLATVIERGEECTLWTAAGDQFLDFSMGWGSVLLGHAHPAVCRAVADQIAAGSNFAYVSCPSLALGEELIRLSPACEAVRFCASGTEATMYCLRLARAFTGRSRILRFEGAYHGAHDLGVTSLFPTEPTDFPNPLPSSAGLVAHHEGRILVSAFNDLENATRLIRSKSDELAGVIVEPLQRCLPPAPGFLEGLRQVTEECRVPLIFDEVVTGFRLAYGGAQEYYGVVPDLVAYGKALGGGMPIGVYGGRGDIMQLVCEDRLGSEHDDYVWTASTLGGNPVSSAAALAALEVFREGQTYRRLHTLGQYLRDGMREVVAKSGIEAQVLGDGPLAQLAFTNQSPRDYRSSQHLDKQLARRTMLGLFRRGIFLNPMGTKLYLSLAHREEHCEIFCEKLADTLAETVDHSEIVDHRRASTLSSSSG